jgi:hypothetical protein
MIVCIQSLLALLWERSNTKQSIVMIFWIPIAGVLIFGIFGFTFIAVTLTLYLKCFGAVKNTLARLCQRTERIIVKHCLRYRRSTRSNL